MYLVLMFCLVYNVRGQRPEAMQEELESGEEPEIVIGYNTIDVDELILNGVPPFKPVELPSIADKIKYNKTEKIYEDFKINLELPLLLTDDMEPIKTANITREILEFNELDDIVVNNITRRRWIGFDDPEDAPKKIEPEKIAKVDNIALQFLIHARYHVKNSINIKNHYRHTFQYKIGYLFNRLRRLRYEQFKLVSLATNQAKSYNWPNFQSLLRFYQKVVRISVDVKDTIDWIKSLHKQSEKIKDEQLQRLAQVQAQAKKQNN